MKRTNQRVRGIEIPEGSENVQEMRWLLKEKKRNETVIIYAAQINKLPEQKKRERLLYNKVILLQVGLTAS